MARLLLGKPVAQAIQNTLVYNISKANMTLKLAIVVVGDNPASAAYVQQKQRFGAALGIIVDICRFDSKVSQNEIVDHINQLNGDQTVHGIIVQLPLPATLDTTACINAVTPNKDVDGLTYANQGKLLADQPGLQSATAGGIMSLLAYYTIPLQGKNVVVIGRSILVGKPVALLLLRENATVTIAHSKTINLKHLTRMADIIVSVVGQPQFLTAEYIKKDAVIIDVGITRTTNGLKGDVDASSVEEVAHDLSPVPGGVGPLTVACLFQNLWQAYLLQQ